MDSEFITRVKSVLNVKNKTTEVQPLLHQGHVPDAEHLYRLMSRLGFWTVSAKAFVHFIKTIREKPLGRRDLEASLQATGWHVDAIKECKPCLYLRSNTVKGELAMDLIKTYANNKLEAGVQVPDSLELKRPHFSQINPSSTIELLYIGCTERAVNLRIKEDERSAKGGKPHGLIGLLYKQQENRDEKAYRLLSAPLTEYRDLYNAERLMTLLIGLASLANIVHGGNDSPEKAPAPLPAELEGSCLGCKSDTQVVWIKPRGPQAVREEGAQLVHRA
ncbi:unnamed protein product [Sympodiomycopsis kandeliae]